MKMPLNLTAELKNLEQQTAEIDHLETQAENNLSTIQVLQNRVFFIEAELKKLSSFPRVFHVFKWHEPINTQFFRK